MPPRPKRVLGGPIKAPEPVHVPPAPLVPPSEPTPTPTPPQIREADVIESVENVSQPVTPDIKEEPTNNIECPICAEKMVSLLQLNRHLDDEHSFGTDSPITSSSSSSSPPDELRSWLKKTNEVKSKLQATLPMKLPKLDIFDPEMRSSPTQAPEIVVTRKHWQKPSMSDACSFPKCHRHLSLKSGIVNCRKCGQLFCNEHANYRVRLDSKAHYNHQGVWSRCCLTCFEGKPGYKDLGLYRELTPIFAELRRSRIDERQLYANRLEKRVANLTSALHRVDRDINADSNNWFQIGAAIKRRTVEQQLVPWEDSSHVLNCFLCLRAFSFALRKHHCRLCGKVVCGDPTCSMEVPVDQLTAVLEEVPRVRDDSLLRMCRRCKQVLLAKKIFEKDVKSPLPPLLAKLETQKKVSHAIEVLMPRFQDAVQRLSINSGSPAELARLRTRLVESFAQFERLTKEILDLQVLTRDEQLLQHAVRGESAAFLQRNMAPLKQAHQVQAAISAEQKTQKQVSKPKFTREQVSQIKKSRDELMVLQEQRYLVHDMMETCKKQRRFDEIAALQTNIAELDKSIEQLQLSLGDEGF